MSLLPLCFPSAVTNAYTIVTISGEIDFARTAVA
jgi:hypothetical protein